MFLINFRNTKIEQQVTIDLQTCQADFEKMAELRKVIGESNVIIGSVVSTSVRNTM